MTATDGRNDEPAGVSRLGRPSGEGGGGGGSSDSSSPITDVVVLFVVALTLLLVSGSAVASLGLARRAGIWGSLVSVALPELAGLLIPSLLFVWQSGQRQRLGMLIVPPSRRISAVLLHLLAGGLLGMTLFYVLSAWLEPLYEHLVRLTPAEQRALERMIVPASGVRPLGLDLLTFALVPALCEEVLFRGAILLTLLPDLGNPQAMDAHRQPARSGAMMLLCAVLFGLIHLSWGRMIPTMLLGMAFALAVRLAGSLWVPVAMHAMNNALVVLMVRRGLSSFVELGWTVRIGLVPVAVVLLWTVLRLLGRGTAAWESARDA